MGEPVSAGVVGSVVAPSFGTAAIAPTISGLAGAGALANPLTTSMITGMNTGMGTGSLFGFNPSLGGIGQGISEYFVKTPIFGREGILSDIGQGVGAYNQFNQLFGQQQKMQPIGAATQRGGQIQPVDYMSLLNPQQQTVIRPATPSLI